MRMRPPPGHASSTHPSSHPTRSPPRMSAYSASVRWNLVRRERRRGGGSLDVAGRLRRVRPPPSGPVLAAPRGRARRLTKSDCATWTTVPHASFGWMNASRHQGLSRFTPTGRIVRRLDTTEQPDDVVGLEGEVVRPLTVADEEPFEEVVLLDVVRLEQLDAQIAAVELHRTEAEVQRRRTAPGAELRDERVDDRRDVARRDGDVVEVDVTSSSCRSRWTVARRTGAPARCGASWRSASRWPSTADVPNVYRCHMTSIAGKWSFSWMSRYGESGSATSRKSRRSSLRV